MSQRMEETDEWNILVEEWIAANVEGDPSYGEMVDAQAWATEQYEKCPECGLVGEHATYCRNS